MTTRVAVIGGGISGDFPICVVPLLHQDLGETDVALLAGLVQASRCERGADHRRPAAAAVPAAVGLLVLLDLVDALRREIDIIRKETGSAPSTVRKAEAVAEIAEEVE